MTESVNTFLLKSWNVGYNPKNGEPTLIVELVDGRRIGVQMPSITANQMGAALVDIGSKTAMPTNTKPN